MVLNSFSLNNSTALEIWILYRATLLDMDVRLAFLLVFQKQEIASLHVCDLAFILEKAENIIYRNWLSQTEKSHRDATRKIVNWFNNFQEIQYFSSLWSGKKIIELLSGRNIETKIQVNRHLIRLRCKIKGTLIF